MKRALIRPDVCNNCTPCNIEDKCSMNAIIRENLTDKPWVDFYRCSGCLKCKGYCNHQAVEEISHPCNGEGRMGW